MVMRYDLATAPWPKPTLPRAELNGEGLCRLHDCSLIAEADHRIANHLALLAGHVRLKAAELAKRPEASGREAIQVLLLGLQAEIAAMARLHRKLSGGNAQAPSDLAHELHEVCAPFRSGLSGDLLLVEDFEPGCPVTAEQILPVTQIVTEVITNALKHAAGDGRGGLLTARLRKGEPSSALIEIIDHGPGFPSAFNPATDGGLGFRVVRALTLQLEATASFSSSAAGVRFTLSLPLAGDDEPCR
jgi:two-component sensor histidine kinase